jgi:glycosyltransferase involved in cell wall biosynthesis
MKPDISVVIPLYNKERYIRRTIDSVLCQTFQNFECIIVDSSNDGSTDIIRKYADPRIVHIKRERIKAAKARNLGVERANAELIAFLDADDEWQPNHLETLLNLKKKCPSAGLFSTAYVKLKPDGKPMVMLFLGIPPPPWEGYLEHYIRICSRGDDPVNSSSTAVLRKIFNAEGGFPEDLDYGEDQYLWGEIALHYSIAYSWKGLTIYHTEASDRICNEPHRIDEHPFSSYLKREMEKGSIPQEDLGDCLAYIRRKRYSHIFSKFLSVGKSSNYHERLINGAPDPKFDWINHLLQTPLECIGYFLSNFYNSRIHEHIRFFICKIYGGYNPGSDLNISNEEGPS